jgi:hypothetical protein
LEASKLGAKSLAQKQQNERKQTASSLQYPDKPPDGVFRNPRNSAERARENGRPTELFLRKWGDQSSHFRKTAKNQKMGALFLKMGGRTEHRISPYGLEKMGGRC